jgi:hypothetical protein
MTSSIDDHIVCRAQLNSWHLYDDPVMLICTHVFCRSCCLELAEKSHEQCCMLRVLI